MKKVWIGLLTKLRKTGTSIRLSSSMVDVIVRPLSTVEYTSVASVFYCRRGLTNVIHDRRGCTLFTLSSVDTSAC